MGSTNKTTNIELSQFLGSDSPKWLTDYNSDMQKIDTFAGAIQAQADATDLVVGGHTTAIETLQGESSDYNTAIQQLRTDVDGNTGSINTINSLIGNGEPTTTDKTLIGAINELDANQNSIDTRVTTLEGFHCFKEIHRVQVTHESGDTIDDMLTKLDTAVISYIENLPNDHYRAVPIAIAAGDGYQGMAEIALSTYLNKNTDFSNKTLKAITNTTSATGIDITEIRLITSHRCRKVSITGTTTVTDELTTAATHDAYVDFMIFV